MMKMGLGVVGMAEGKDGKKCEYFTLLLLRPYKNVTSLGIDDCILLYVYRRDKRYDRSYNRAYDDEQTSPRREFTRSMSGENWRDAKKEEDEEGDWRRAGGSRDRWNTSKLK